MDISRRIAIITLPGYFNYGSRLQNYALVRSLQKMGHNVDTLVVKPNEQQPDPSPKLLFRIFRKRKISNFIRILGNNLNGFIDNQYNQSIKEKEIKLKQFSYKYLRS
jgi:hypothetical protein